jgi:hypothetical protein
VAIYEPPKEMIKTDYARIYPNPTADFIEIVLHSNASTGREIQICDVYGKKILLEKLPKHATTARVDVSFFPKGMYWVLIKESGKNTFTQKLVKL